MSLWCRGIPASSASSHLAEASNKAQVSGVLVASQGLSWWQHVSCTALQEAFAAVSLQAEHLLLLQALCSETA